MSILKYIIIFFIILLNCQNILAADPVIQNKQPLKILRITPSGVDVPAGQQIVIQFNRPVVPVGRMDRKPEEIPIIIVPKVNCQWRWLNNSALACQLTEKEALKLSTRYWIEINSGIQTEDRVTTSEIVHHTFITQRPKITNADLKSWNSPGTPYIRAYFNQPVLKKSVEKHIYMFTDNNKNKRIPINVETDPDMEEKPLILEDKSEASRLWVIYPKTELDLDKKAALFEEAGLVSPFGQEKGIENRIVVSFDTFPKFYFEGISCTNIKGEKVTIKPNEPLENQEKCNPLKSSGMIFSSPVTFDEIKNNIKITPDLAGDRKDYDPWAKYSSYSNLYAPHKKDQKYIIHFPEKLKAASEYEIKSNIEKFIDEFGRKPEKPINMKFRTDHRAANFVLTHPKAILEKEINSDMPIVVTNLNTVELNYEKLTQKGKEANLKQVYSIPKVLDLSFKVPLEIRKLLDNKSGIIKGVVNTIPSVVKDPEQHVFFAQVTPFQLHVKIGHYNTLIWVVDLNTGLVVPDADVQIYKDLYNSLNANTEILDQGKTDKSGIAMLKGLNNLDPELKYLHPDMNTSPVFFVRVGKADDISVLPLTYDYSVDTYRASNYSIFSEMKKLYGHAHSWGTTAQGVYKAGDTIQYKIYVRDQNNEKFVPSPKEGYNLKVVDPMGKVVNEVKDIILSEFGAFNGEFSVPVNGAVGWYEFQLSCKFSDFILNPMKVLVSDFTPAPFKVTVDLNGQKFETGQTVQVNTQATLHGGGPYSDASGRITATLEMQRLKAKELRFKDFNFDAYLPETQTRQVVFQAEEMMDKQGKLLKPFTINQSNILYGKLTVESAVRDDRGKYITNSAAADYVGRDRFVGLKNTSWMFKENEPASVELIVIDQNGQSVKDTLINLKVEYQKTTASRVKGAGNAFITRYNTEWVEVERSEIKSDINPVKFTFTPKSPGSHRLIASVTDTKNLSQTTMLYLWASGKGQIVWDEGEDNKLEIISEKDSYKVGDKARYMVKNPFPGSVALVTIERYGVLKNFLQNFDTSMPVVEFEVEKDFIPGFFLSVIIMSKRIEKPLTNEGVDLGKPAFRMGYISVSVKDPYKEIIVSVNPANEVYKPREKVKVDLKASLRNGELNEGVEIAVAVLDEAILDLISQGKEYFDPYKGFYSIDGLDLENYSLLMKLVGRQKFEKKGANSGGCGGLDLGLRSVFKFVSYWNPSIITDKEGRASIEFDVPDNLTSWRVLAMAVTPGDKMGLGDNVFKVNRATEIRTVMPNQVIEGDQFEAGFTIMNRTPDVRELCLNIEADGQKITQTFKAEPFKRIPVWMPIKTTTDGEIKFTAQGGDASDKDALTHTIKVLKRYSMETAANYGTNESGLTQENFLFPNNMRTDVGRVSLVISPSVISNVEGAFGYLRDYPYVCWEQVLTKGVMASHYKNLKQYISKNFKWDESENLAQKTLDRAASFQAPNGGMCYYVPEDQYVCPYLSSYTAIAFNWLKDSGYKIPSGVETRLHEYLLTLLRRDVVPDFYSKGMASTVRAAALAALSKNGKINASDIMRYQNYISEMSLFGKAHILQASLMVNGTENIQNEIVKLILSHANQSGGKFVFTEALDESYLRILSSTTRDNGAILSALVLFAKTHKDDKSVGDILFKLVNYISQNRKNRDFWENTQENMFCMQALIDYSKLYENIKPDMNLSVYFDNEIMGEAKFSDLRDDSKEIERKIKPSDPGKKSVLKIDRKGQGRYYYASRLFYAPNSLNKDSINSGMEIKREYSVKRDNKWMLLKSPIQIKQGELIKVDIYLTTPAARNFVVIDDPVPGALEPVNRDLKTASKIDSDEAEFNAQEGSFWFEHKDWISYGVSRWSFYHKELRNDSARFYSEYLPQGNYHLSYAAQAIASGDFISLPIHAEEMYNPDVFGKGVPENLNVNRK